MFRFTIRELCGLMVVAMIACGIALLFAPTDPLSAMLATVVLFSFGGTSYAAGILVGRRSNS